MKKKNILLIASYAGSLIWFRGDFIKSLIANQFKVFTAAPNYTEEDIELLSDLGATPVEFNLQ
ncbi:MAG: hypothetical protein ABJ218_03150, partial [Winogradskyella arenosi]